MIRFYCILCLIVLLFGKEVFCQGIPVTYGYDDSGNRIQRMITLQKSLSMPDDNGTTGNTGSNNDGLDEYADQLEEVLIKIFPNPTKGLLHIEFSHLPEGESMIQVYNLKGELLLNNTSLELSSFVDLSASKEGLYFLRIKIGGRYTEWKIIKQ